MDECWTLEKYTDAAKRVCLSECPEGFARGRDGAGNWICVCQRGLLFDAEKNSCVSQKECTGYSYSLDGDFLRCVSKEECAEMGLLVFTHDGTAECADKCPEWWYKEDDSECVEEAWRKNTAIAVPVAVVAVVVIVVVVIIVVKQKRKIKAQEVQEPTKLHVVKT